MAYKTQNQKKDLPKVPVERTKSKERDARVLNMNRARIKFKGFKHLPRDEKEILKFCNALITAVYSDDDFFEADEYIADQGYNPSKVYRLRNQYDYLDNTLTLIDTKIAARLRRGMRKQEIDIGYGLSQLPMHDEKYKEMRVQIASKLSPQQSNQIQIIEIPTF